MKNFKTVFTGVMVITLATLLVGPMNTIAEEKTACTDEKQKVRTIITSDWLDDDQCSFVRYLLYANEFETIGLVADKTFEKPFTYDGIVYENKAIAQRIIDAYAKDYEMLSQNADGYPTPEYLTSINMDGSIIQDDLSVSEGSELIRSAIMDDREDMLFIQCWGGVGSVAAALKSIEDEYKNTNQWDAVKEKVMKKVVIYHDLGQDNMLDQYIIPNWEGLSVIMSFTSFQALGVPPWGYMTVSMEELELFSGDWVKSNITNGESALSEIYKEVSGINKKVVSGYAGYEDISHAVAEGDTPNFFYILDVGLRQTENPSYGGWAGRYYKQNLHFEMETWRSEYLEQRTLMPVTAPYGLWVEARDNGNLFRPITRWAVAFQNDFAARMQWTTRPYTETNHAPTISILEGTDFVAKHGDTITLTVVTDDPDEDEVNVVFWQYDEADTYGKTVELECKDNVCTFTVPDDAIIGDTIHIIVEAIDTGAIPVTRYQRAIISVTE